MDPVSIALTCATVVGKLVMSTKAATGFVNEVKDARSDMEQVVVEMNSLSLLLEQLNGELHRSACQKLPRKVLRPLRGLVEDCSLTMDDISNLLQELKNRKIVSGVQWAIYGKGEMLAFQTRLESHKSALNISLGMINVSINRDVKKDTTAILHNTTTIKEDTTMLLTEAADLKQNMSQIPSLKDDVAQKMTQILAAIASLNAKLETSEVKNLNVDNGMKKWLNSLEEYAETECGNLETDQADSGFLEEDLLISFDDSVSAVNIASSNPFGRQDQAPPGPAQTGLGPCVSAPFGFFDLPASPIPSFTPIENTKIYERPIFGTSDYFSQSTSSIRSADNRPSSTIASPWPINANATSSQSVSELASSNRVPTASRPSLPNDRAALKEKVSQNTPKSPTGNNSLFIAFRPTSNGGRIVPDDFPVITRRPAESQVEYVVRRARTYVEDSSTEDITFISLSVSRYHAMVKYSNGEWLVKDTGSTGGTLVNGTRIGQNYVQLDDGDIIQFGCFRPWLDYVGNSDPRHDNAIEKYVTVRVSLNCHCASCQTARSKKAGVEGAGPQKDARQDCSCNMCIQAKEKRAQLRSTPKEPKLPAKEDCACIDCVKSRRKPKLPIKEDCACMDCIKARQKPLAVPKPAPARVSISSSLKNIFIHS